jgi:CBS domain-containing protein
MSRDPIALPPTARVADAAGLMLRHRCHRVPVVDPATKAVLGLVSRTDIFTVMLKNGTPPAT